MRKLASALYLCKKRRKEKNYFGYLKIKAKEMKQLQSTPKSMFCSKTWLSYFIKQEPLTNSPRNPTIVTTFLVNQLLPACSDVLPFPHRLPCNTGDNGRPLHFPSIHTHLLASRLRSRHLRFWHSENQLLSTWTRTVNPIKALIYRNSFLFYSVLMNKA